MLNLILDKAKNNSELSLVFEEMEQKDNTTTPKHVSWDFIRYWYQVSWGSKKEGLRSTVWEILS